MKIWIVDPCDSEDIEGVFASLEGAKASRPGQNWEFKPDEDLWRCDLNFEAEYPLPAEIYCMDLQP